MRRRSLALLITVAVVTMLAACSDSGDGGDGGGDGGGLSAEEQEYAAAFAATLEDDEDGLSVAADEADCMAEAVMAELGVEPFEEADVAAEDIEPGGDSSSPGELLGDDAVSDEQANAIIDVWEDDCVDLVEVLVESGGAEFDLDDEGKGCFREGLGEDDLAARLLVGTFTTEDGAPDDATVNDLLELLESCGGEDGGPIVSSIAESLAADGNLTPDQAQCLAQGVVDQIGTGRMGELFAAGGFDDLDSAGQSEVTGALLEAASSCDVPLSAFGG